MSEIHFQRIGSKHLLSPPSLVLTYNGNKCLINVGENIQRYCFEHKIRLARLRSILLTNISVETIGGLPGLLLTLIGVGVQKLRIVGPEPITQYLLMFGYVIRNQKRQKNSLNTVVSINSQEFLDNFDGVKSDLEIEIIQIMPTSSLEPLKLELDHELSLECYLNYSLSVPQTCVSVEHNMCPSSKKRCTENSLSCLSSPSILYMLEFPEKRGKFDVIKAKELGVPPGPLYSKLKNGESVQISGSKIIQPNDVCSPPIKLPWSIILHALNPTEFDFFYSVISQILDSKGFDFSKTTLDSINCLNGQHESISNFYIFQFQAYFDSLLDSNPNSLKLDSCFIQNKHYLSKGTIKVIRLNERLNSLKEQEINPFVTSHFLQEFLNNISPNLFPLSSAKVDELAWNQQFFISSNQKSLQNTNSIANIHKKRAKFTPISQESEDQILFLKQEFQGIFSNYIENHPNLLFPLLYVLGTGSAIPSPYRNVSGCLLRVDDNTSMLLDCGEGSMSQLFGLCKFDFNLFSEIIASIKIVFISHPHEDHFLGIFNLLKLKNSVGIQRIKNVSELTQNDNFYYIKYHQNLQQVKEVYFNGEIKSRDFKNLVLIGPKKVEKIYNLFQNKIIQDKVNRVKDFEISFIAIDKRMNESPENRSDGNQLLLDDFFLKLEQFPVKHIKSSYGLKVTLKLENKVESGGDCSLFKIVFSGDTATPCKSLEDASKDCDVLIHEATFEDNLSKDAQEKNHSTISGAIGTAYNSSAKFLLLTHFSQRYFSMPKVEIKSEYLNRYFLNKTLCMMDLMIIPLQRMGKLIERFHNLNKLIRDYLPQV
ncbi:mbl domain containing [Cryptosporidium sp. chipmunk genotype I]|uniref:mbl domain containing n=1 Tax=Cryptosporidium sp. chipmunk genotype I TaxID=1280935 RepID=UPI00351A4E5D|nr:mbl domain containing [Cryptosporidium sp. chipmunk genotype I]